MEVRTIFRNLVKNHFMKDFDYRTRFKFQTLFHISSNSYCCCRCGPELEFIDYIDENGKIDEAIYEKIIQSIIDGKCPHVNNKVPDQSWVTETSITGLHVAVATNIELTKIINHDFANTATSIFGLQLYAMALKKKKYDQVYYYFRRCVDDDSQADVLFNYTTQDNTSCSISKMSAIEAIVQADDEKLLKDILRLDSCMKGRRTKRKDMNLFRQAYMWGSVFKMKDLNFAFQYALKYNLLKAEDILLKHIPMRNQIKSGIMYNKPETLDRILRCIYLYLVPARFDEDQKRYSIICRALNRQKCIEKLSKYKIFHKGENSFADYKLCLLTLQELLDYEDFRSKISEALMLKVSEMSEHFPSHTQPISFHDSLDVFCILIFTIPTVKDRFSPRVSRYHFLHPVTQCPLLMSRSRPGIFDWFLRGSLLAFHEYLHLLQIHEDTLTEADLTDAWSKHHKGVRNLVKSYVAANPNLVNLTKVVPLALEMDHREYFTEIFRI